LAREQRRLAAILAADVVGYSRLMGWDESGTVARLRDLRVRRLEPLLVRHGGRLVKLTGDGALIEFVSAVDALSAAIEFQQATTDANHDQPEDTAIVFRMGLHLGGVIVEGDDLYGDAVNVADRLETEAPPGGIVVSDVVREAAGGRLKATFADRGGLTLKNIERPIHAFGVNWEPADWPVPQTPSSGVVSGRVPASGKRRTLWAAGAACFVIIAAAGYYTFAPRLAGTMTGLLTEGRAADAEAAEKKRPEEEAKTKAETEGVTGGRKADEALAMSPGERLKAEAEARDKAAAALASGLIVLPSKFSVSVTVQRLENAIRSAPPEHSMKLIRRVDLAAEAERIGVKSLPRMFVEFGDARIRAIGLSQAPTSALEGPIRVVVWQDDENKVWLAYNSADWWQKTRARHGLTTPTLHVEAYGQILSDLALKATK
jgi:class 3 adenylate cyclase/uncharacterized protein (DUF302 family)